MQVFNSRTKTHRTITFFDKYLSLSGRLGRKAYFLRNCWLFLVSVMLSVVVTTLAIMTSRIGVGIFTIILTILIAPFTISLDWRRFQDLGKPGWYSIIIFLIVCLPNSFWGYGAIIILMLRIIAFCTFLYLLLIKGTEGYNVYGEDPTDEFIMGTDIVERMIFWPTFIGFVFVFISMVFAGPSPVIPRVLQQQVIPKNTTTVDQQKLREQMEEKRQQIDDEIRIRNQEVRERIEREREEDKKQINERLKKTREEIKVHEGEKEQGKKEWDFKRQKPLPPKINQQN